MTSKTCSICLKTKLLDEFYKTHNDGGSGRRKECKSCFRHRKGITKTIRKRNEMSRESNYTEIKCDIDNILKATQDMLSGFMSVVRTQDKIIEVLQDNGMLGRDNDDGKSDNSSGEQLLSNDDKLSEAMLNVKGKRWADTPYLNSDDD